MNEDDAALLGGLFKRYYFENAGRIHVPHKMGRREFGYQRFNGGMNRHLAMRDDGALRVMLVSNSPSDVYCSNAYYSFPDLPMNEKDWKGADLIFDIDAKDLNLECRAGHTVYRCSDCMAVSRDASACRACGSARLDSKSVACRDCIDASKKEVRKLEDILVRDFGIPEGSIRVYFSGNEGFHVHAHAPHFEQLNSRERGELVDYIRFNGAVPERFGMTRRQPKRDLQKTLPELGDAGWAGRVAKGIFVNKTGRKRFISQIDGDAYDSYQRSLREIAGTIGARIDPQVTTDVHRIFRMPDSLNGKSGMAKVPCGDLDSFDPHVDACVLDDGPVTVTARCPVAFRLKGHAFGPYDSEQVTVPGYAAAYMLCKGLATSSGA